MGATLPTNSPSVPSKTSIRPACCLWLHHNSTKPAVKHPKISGMGNNKGATIFCSRNIPSPSHANTSLEPYPGFPQSWANDGRPLITVPLLRQPQPQQPYLAYARWRAWSPESCSGYLVSRSELHLGEQRRHRQPETRPCGKPLADPGMLSK